MSRSSTYPSKVLDKVEGQSYFHFRPSVSYLFSLVTDADFSDIKNTKILSRAYPHYIPWYSASKGGGAITLGNSNWSRIYFTENFFSQDQELFKTSAYANNIGVWLRLASHEVSHIAHAKRFKSIIIYLTVFIYQYIIYGHDKAPLEIEADAGTLKYHRFAHYIKMQSGMTIFNLLESDKSEEEKIAFIRDAWSRYNTIA
ncbi:hypothetical protein N9L92_04815 [Saprospiraceae bacterium]|nr:hypothetical protein [Saprospiraceae bacterium]